MPAEDDLPVAAALPGRDDVAVRDHLALIRTRLANERTMLAYARTAIMLAATGVTLLALYGDALLPVVAGWGLVLSGVGVALLGTARFQRLTRSLK